MIAGLIKTERANDFILKPRHADYCPDGAERF